MLKLLLNSTNLNLQLKQLSLLEENPSHESHSKYLYRLHLFLAILISLKLFLIITYLVMEMHM